MVLVELVKFRTFFLNVSYGLSAICMKLCTYNLQMCFIKSYQKNFGTPKNAVAITKHMLFHILEKVYKCIFYVTIFMAHAKSAQKAYRYGYPTV